MMVNSETKGATINALDKESELVSRISASLFNERRVTVKPILGKGNVNKVFVVGLTDGKVVVRMSDRNAALEEYTKEAWCIGGASSVGWTHRSSF
jgi:hypothetical protein